MASEIGASPEVAEQVYRAMIAAFIDEELKTHAALAGQAKTAGPLWPLPKAATNGCVPIRQLLLGTKHGEPCNSAMYLPVTFSALDMAGLRMRTCPSTPRNKSATGATAGQGF
ncbi:hypothetical protein [Pseudomonas sp.]|uniref:hypothetical protein n=1 Tax=Pseudomonas sp. TaxID=306 RepID=UPI003CC5F0BC